MRHITLYFCDSVICVCVCRTACCLGVQVRHIALCFRESDIVCVCRTVCCLGVQVQHITLRFVIL